MAPGPGPESLGAALGSRRAVPRARDAVPALAASRWLAAPESPPGPGRAELQVELLPLDDPNAEPWQTLWVGPRDGTGRLVRDGDEGWVLRLDATVVEDPFSALGAALGRP